MEDYSAMTRKKILLFEITWMDLDGTMLHSSEKQTVKW